MRRLAYICLGVLAWLGFAPAAAWAQTAEGTQVAADLRERVNQGTVTIISGGVAGTYIRIAADLASVLDKGYDLRVLPIIGKGSVQNITDILYLRGIDIGIVQSDVLAFIRSKRIHPTIEQRIRYITKLYNEEFHLLAGKDITTIEDLAGKKVNFGNEGSGTYMTAATVFDTLKIQVEPTTFDYALAVEKIRTGEIAAMVYVAGKPTSLFASMERGEGLYFVSIPITPALLETYLPAEFGHADYPALIPDGEAVATIAVGAVMAVYNWPAGHERFQKVERFVKAFFENFDQFLRPPRHDKWQEVNLAASVPGWTRFKPADDWLKAQPVQRVAEADPELRAAFEAFLDFIKDPRSESAAAAVDRGDMQALFQQFLEWRERQGR